MSQREQTNGAAYPRVAIAVDKGKSSNAAFKWALSNVVAKGQTITLVHVNNVKSSSPGHEDDAAAKASTISVAGEKQSHSSIVKQTENFFDTKAPSHQNRSSLLSLISTIFKVACNEIMLEDTDVARAILAFVVDAAIEKLVIGASASSRTGFFRSFRNADLSNIIYKGTPDFCSVYVIYKGKVSSVKHAVRPAPVVHPLKNQNDGRVLNNNHKESMKVPSEDTFATRNKQDSESIKSPFDRRANASPAKHYGEPMAGSNNNSCTSSGWPSFEQPYTSRISNTSDSVNRNFESPRWSAGAYSIYSGCSYQSDDNFSSQPTDDAGAEISRLRLELKQTMDMCSTAFKEALTAKQTAMELRSWKKEEQQLHETRLAEEAAMRLSESEKAKSASATGATEASKMIRESEAQRRICTEMKANKEAEERKDFDALPHKNLRYRRYTIEEIEVATNHYSADRKIGEGGYGPVYRGYLDHTPVAIKALRPDADQGRSQFHKEVEILCSIRHPNMVLLLGACPENGCLVYEYMANGSLEDRLFRQGNTPPLPWQHRFRIAAEIGTCLLFLHQSKPEPLVHRDLKPANILLDRNYVSKISDVGLARLVPPSVAENVTQYLMTATAGTFCYIDPEYQQSGMLGTKSDIYSLGIILLQLLTSKPPMGLAHQVEDAIERGKLAALLDQSVPDWPLEEASSLANVALQCAELRRKDRPDLATVILPLLNRLRDVAEESMQLSMFGNGSRKVSAQDIMNLPSTTHSGYEDTIRSGHSGPSMPRRFV